MKKRVLAPLVLLVLLATMCRHADTQKNDARSSAQASINNNMAVAESLRAMLYDRLDFSDSAVKCLAATPQKKVVEMRPVATSAIEPVHYSGFEVPR